MGMFSSLDNTNPYGIRVVTDNAPVREDVKEAFARGSRGAAAKIAALTQPKHRRGGSPVARRSTAKRSD
jgi:hypothetical protein